MREQVHVFAPGSVGNLGPGLDILGLAIGGLGDAVRARRTAGRGIVVEEAGDPSLPTDPSRHASAIAAHAVLRAAGADFGLALRLEKGLPLSGGQGGSASSAVAGAVAANLLLDQPLPVEALLLAALESETVLSGRHADNIAPILLGGLVLIRSLDPLDVLRLPVPEGLLVVLAHPDRKLNTRDGRAALPREVSRDTALHQAAQVAAIVAAAYSGDLALLGRSIDDRIAEPARAPLLDGFLAAKRAALAAGALGCSISGSGPTAFAIVGSERQGEAVGAAMRRAYTEAEVSATIRVAAPDLIGARAL
ncbi:MAG: homoserine kinase [Gemmatimonadales bacterium]|nr:homoserine kinase [Gemmatimonadales bacterium]